MYLGIDVGATKTLFAVFDESGEMVCECKIKTDHDYQKFKAGVASELTRLLSRFKFSRCCAAFPGRLDLLTGTALDFGNLDWHNIPAKKDLQEILPGVPVLIHNDAKLAALSEVKLLQRKYKKVLYLTVSTGIGGGVITNDIIDPDFEVFEPGQMVYEHDGKLQQWEDLASGRALSRRYGKLASEINDPAIWKEYSGLLIVGLENLLATVQPDAVIFGGGVGAHFEKFQQFLQEGLDRIDNPLVPTPPLLKARRAEEAVIYGCYDYIKQNI